MDLGLYGGHLVKKQLFALFATVVRRLAIAVCTYADMTTQCERLRGWKIKPRLKPGELNHIAGDVALYGLILKMCEIIVF